MASEISLSFPPAPPSFLQVHHHASSPDNLSGFLLRLEININQIKEKILNKYEK
jgi:hypothetical protein